MSKRILVTGGAGYIGSVLVPLLLEQGHQVRVLDNLRWGGESLLGIIHHPGFELIKGDVRDTEAVRNALRDVAGVVHLAAIVGDPACRKESMLATETNYVASTQLLEEAHRQKVKRFVFASTCSNYGKMPDPNTYCDERSTLSPVSLYAELKVKFEKCLLESDRDICVTALRFSTAYGLAPRMRFDLTVSEFTRDAVTKKELVIYGERFWRPYCHAIDLARACIQILAAERKNVDRQAFNVGEDGENYQKQMIAEEIQRQIPDVQIQYIHKDEDPRDYRVSFAKIRKLGFVITKKVPDGIREVKKAIEIGLIRNHFYPKYSNI